MSTNGVSPTGLRACIESKVCTGICVLRLSVLLFPDLMIRLTVPVIGNGDIMNYGDALRMIKETKCKAVMIGRGCLGRPWLIRETANSMLGLAIPDTRETLVLSSLIRHAHHLAAHECGWLR